MNKKEKLCAKNGISAKTPEKPHAARDEALAHKGLVPVETVTDTDLI